MVDWRKMENYVVIHSIDSAIAFKGEMLTFSELEVLGELMNSPVANINTARDYLISIGKEIVERCDNISRFPMSFLDGQRV